MEKLKYGSYLICHEHIKEVRDFLSNFFEEITNEYTHENWRTFKIPNSEFLVNLMKGNDQELTQNMVFEIYCSSMNQLKEFAEKYNVKVENFTVTEVKDSYIYSYIQISSPKNICKIELSYIQK